MIIVGAGGFAKELLEVFYLRNDLQNISFYDDLNNERGNLFLKEFPILRNTQEVLEFFKMYNNNEYTIGIGNPQLRFSSYQKFRNLGGEFISTISPLAKIGHYDVEIEEGSNVLSNAVISNGVKIGRGCLIYYNVIVTHDCDVGAFVELSPGATLLGGSKIGNFSHIGSNSTILPNITIGENVTIGAGAVVTKDVPSNSIAVGVPSRIIKTKPHF